MSPLATRSATELVWFVAPASAYAPLAVAPITPVVSTTDRPASEARMRGDFRDGAKNAYIGISSVLLDPAPRVGAL